MEFVIWLLLSVYHAHRMQLAVRFLFIAYIGRVEEVATTDGYQFTCIMHAMCVVMGIIWFNCQNFGFSNLDYVVPLGFTLTSITFAYIANVLKYK